MHQTVARVLALRHRRARNRSACRRRPVVGATKQRSGATAARRHGALCSGVRVGARRRGPRHRDFRSAAGLRHAPGGGSREGRSRLRCAARDDRRSAAQAGSADSRQCRAGPAQSSQLNRKLMLPFFDLPQVLFGSFDALLDPRNDKARYAAALTRLKRYTGRESGYTPITTLMQARARRALRHGGTDRALDRRSAAEPRQQPALCRRHPQGFRAQRRQGLAERPRTARHAAQGNTRRGCSRTCCRARARRTSCPPRSMRTTCAASACARSPRLMQQALVSFVQTRDELDALAKQVAQRRGLASSDYRDVIRALKAEEIPNDKLWMPYRANSSSSRTSCARKTSSRCRSATR